MSSKTSVQKITARVRGQMDDMKTKKTEKKMDVKECIQHLKSGNVHLIDIEGVIEEFPQKLQLGDLLQYELHNYCKTNSNPDPNVSVVVSLADLCYSHSSVTLFENMDRFLGCSYYISLYLLKNEKFQEAIKIVKSLEFQKKKLIETSKKSKSIANVLYNFHSAFISTATDLTNKISKKTNKIYQISHELAIQSLKLFEYMTSEHLQATKKVLRTSKLYLHSMLFYKDEDILEFYQNLKVALKNLFPGFCELDYCLYFIYKLDNMKNWDYSKGMDVFQNLKRVSHIFLLLTNFIIKYENKLNSVLEFFFVMPYENICLENTFLNANPLKDLLIADQGNENYCIFLMTSYIFHHGIQHWWKLFEDDWNSRISSDVIQKLFQIILDLHQQFFNTASFYCSKIKSPYETCFGDLLTSNLQKIQYTVRLYLKSKNLQSLALVSISRHAFKLSIECIDFMKKMGCCKMQRQQAWKTSVIHHTNTVEDILQYSPSDDNWHFLQDCSQEILQQIMKGEYEMPFDKKRIKILFQRWHKAVIKLEKYSEGMFVTMLLYICCPEEKSDIIYMWQLSKTKCDNEVLQDFTMNEVLKNWHLAIKKFYPKYEREQINSKSLLLTELKSYTSCDAESYKNLNTIYNLSLRLWKQLEKLEPDPCETSLALVCLFSTNIAGDLNKLPENIIEKSKTYINKLVTSTYKKKLQCRNFIHAGNLKLSLFLYQIKLFESSRLQLDSSELKLNYLKKVEEENVKFGEDVDLNLSCNVMPSSSQLTVELETNYINSLKEIVDVWERGLTLGMDELPTPSEFESWLENVNLVAKVFELLGEYYLSLSTWLLFYKIGKLCDNLNAILLGLSRIMSNCADVDSCELMKESEDAANKLDSEKDKDKEILLEYWLSIASNYIKNKKYEKSLEHLSKARTVLANLKTSVRSYTLNARFWYLVSQLIICQPGLEVEFGFPANTDFRIVVFRAFSYVSSCAKNHILSSATRLESIELVLTMLEVNLFAFHYHEIYSLTDLMRFFLGDLYQIVQRFFLPTRTAEILVCLAEVDVICEKYSDCQEKVDKLKNILTTMSSNATQKRKITNENKNFLNVPKVPIVPKKLDNPCPRAVSPARFAKKSPNVRDGLSLSPMAHELADLKGTKMISHKDNCKCRLCKNLLIQILTMLTLGLDAAIHLSENRIKQAVSSYDLANNILNKLEYLRTESSEIIKLEFTNSLTKNLGDIEFMIRPVQFYSARFLITFGFFELSVSGEITDKLNKALIKIRKYMEKFSYEQKFLVWKFAKLKLLSLEAFKCKNKRTSKKSVSPVVSKSENIDHLSPRETDEIILTPVVKQHKDNQVTPSNKEPNTNYGVKSTIVKKNSRRLIFNEDKLSQIDQDPFLF